MKILAATDGSDFSLAAVKKCCSLISAAEKNEFKIIAVYQAYVPVDVFAASISYSEDLEKSLREQAEKNCVETVAKLREWLTDKDFAVTTKVCCGAADREIVETAREWNADLIVVGSHGRGFWGRAMLGSVSDAVIHQAPCSVLVVRGE